MALETNIQAISLDDILATENIAELLDDNSKAALASKVTSKYDEDFSSVSKKLGFLKDIKGLVEPYVEQKSQPFEDASNIKIPLLVQSAMNFSAEAYPVVVKSDAVQVRTVGDEATTLDPNTGQEVETSEKDKRAQRIQEHMNWQLMGRNECWDKDTDKLLFMLPIMGTMFRKVRFDPQTNSNESYLISPENLIVNKDATSLERDTATHRFYMHGWIITERVNSEQYIKQEKEIDYEDEYEILEQHTRIDLDGDGYPEPYIVTINNVTNEILRVEKRFDEDDIEYNSGGISSIKAQIFIVKYEMMPDPEGSFYGMGFGHLLCGINNSINTSVNQMIDAGRLSNTASGFFAKGVRMKGGNYKMSIGKFPMIDTDGRDIREVFLPIKFNEPSSVLYSLMGFLLDYGRNLTGMNEAAMGELRGGNIAATTTLAMIERGIKSFRGIIKRVYRSLKQEFQIYYDFNSRYLREEDYINILDNPNAVAREDYEMGDYDVDPVADLSSITSMQKLVKAEQLMGLAQRGLVDPKLATKMYLEALDVSDSDELLNYEPTNQELQLQQSLIQRDILQEQNKQIELQIEAQKLGLDARKVEINEAKTNADIGKTLAETDKLRQDIINEVTTNIRDFIDEQNTNTGPAPGMEGPGDNANLL